MLMFPSKQQRSMNRDTLILLSVTLLMAMLLTRTAAGQSQQPGNSPREQAIPSRPLTRDAAHSSRDARPSRTITRRGNPSTANTGRSGNKVKSTTTFWKTAGSLAVIVFLILAAGRILKKRGGGMGNTLPTEAVELLGRRYIDQRQVIHLVRLGSRILVLGSSPDGLRSLAEITDPVEIDYLAGVCRPADSSHGITQTFRGLFARRQHTESDGMISMSEPNPAEQYSADSSMQPGAELHHIPG